LARSRSPTGVAENMHIKRAAGPERPAALSISQTSTRLVYFFAFFPAFSATAAWAAANLAIGTRYGEQLT